MPPPTRRVSTISTARITNSPPLPGRGDLPPPPPPTLLLVGGIPPALAVRLAAAPVAPPAAPTTAIFPEFPRLGVDWTKGTCGCAEGTGAMVGMTGSFAVVLPGNTIGAGPAPLVVEVELTDGDGGVVCAEMSGASELPATDPANGRGD